MPAPYNHRAATGTPASSPGDPPPVSTDRDFITPDGRVVPHALGQAGLRQRTALLVGGMLLGQWPDHL